MSEYRYLCIGVTHLAKGLHTVTTFLYPRVCIISKIQFRHTNWHTLFDTFNDASDIFTTVAMLVKLPPVPSVISISTGDRSFLILIYSIKVFVRSHLSKLVITTPHVRHVTNYRFGDISSMSHTDTGYICINYWCFEQLHSDVHWFAQQFHLLSFT